MPSQSPTVWRLPSYSGPEICECRQRQISQLDHGRLWVTREPSFHLPDQRLCEITLQDIYIISLPHLYLLPRWMGYVPEMTRSGPRGIPSFPGSVYSKPLDDWECPSSSTSIIRTTCKTFRLRQPHTWWASELHVAFQEQSGEGQSPFRLSIWLLNSNRLFH